jgi:hypothetical protein
VSIPARKITKADLEAKFAELQSGASHTVADAKQKLMAAVAVGGILVVVLSFLLGRRNGRRKNTIVEIRRV